MADETNILNTYSEAVALYKLALRPGQSIEMIRKDICPRADTDGAMWIHRRRVLRYFDCFIKESRVVPLREFKKEPKLKIPKRTESESLYALVVEILGGRYA